MTTDKDADLFDLSFGFSSDPAPRDPAVKAAEEAREARIARAAADAYDAAMASFNGDEQKARDAARHAARKMKLQIEAEEGKPSPRREAFLILTASLKAAPRWAWRPVGSKRSKVTGLSSRDEAIKSLQAAGYVLVDRPVGQ